MPRVIHRIFRLLLIDKCLRDENKEYHINDLVNVCNAAMLENYGVGISKRTIQYDLNILKKAPFNIELDEDLQKRGIYRYLDVKCTLPVFMMFEDENLNTYDAKGRFVANEVTAVVQIPQEVMQQVEVFFVKNNIKVITPI